MSHKVEIVSKNKRIVLYQCPRCGEALQSPLTDAGNKDKCPICAFEMVVPGDKELLDWHKEQEEEERRVERIKIDEVRRKAAAKLAADIQFQKEESRRAAERAKVQQQRERKRRALGKSPMADAADRFLQWAFSFGKVVSIVVIIICSFVIGVSTARLFTVQEEPPHTIVPKVTTPTAASCPLFQTAHPSGDSAIGTPDQQANSASVEDPMDRRLNNILALYQVSLSNAERIRHDYIMSGPEYAGAFVEGLEKFVVDAKSAHKTIDVYALLWYAAQFKDHVDAVGAAEKEREQEQSYARAEASAKRMYLMTLIGGGIAALLSFLFLPLLIQIEFNTRKIVEQEVKEHTPPPEPAGSLV